MSDITDFTLISRVDYVKRPAPMIKFRHSALIESEVSSKEFRQNWARLIQKVYNVDPLLD